MINNIYSYIYFRNMDLESGVLLLPIYQREMENSAGKDGKILNFSKINFNIITIKLFKVESS